MDEQLKLPSDKPVAELIWLAGGEVDESCYSLRFFGDDLNPDFITQVLGIQPTRSCRKSDIRRGKVYNIIEKTGSWRHSTKRNAEIDIEEQINQLFDKLPTSLDVWINLTNQFYADLFCGVFLKRWNRGLSFSPQTLMRISERGLLLNLDIYF